MSEYATVEDCRAAIQRIELARSLVLQAIDALHKGDTSAGLHGRENASNSLEYAQERLSHDAADWQSEIDRSDCPCGLAQSACTLCDPCQEHACENCGEHASQDIDGAMLKYCHACMAVFYPHS